jgi:hypothetical protein
LIIGRPRGACSFPARYDRTMVDLPGGKILGRLEDPVTGEPIDAAEEERFMKCPACGGVLDMRDLAAALAHHGALPHPGQDRTN